MSAPISAADWERQRRAATSAMPGVIAEVGLPKVLLPYQARTVSLLESTAARVLFIEKSRRVGLTWGLAAYAVLRAGREKSAGGMDAMYISYSQEMTREFIDACAMWARAFSMAAMEADELLFEDANPADPSDTKHIQAFRIRFASGFEILALSSAPRGLRGKQGVVIIDEAAFVDSLAELLKAALAFLMWGGQVVVCSTHNGADNPFNQTVQDILSDRAPHKHIRIDFDDALRDGLYQRICLVTGKDWSPEAEASWRQEIIDFYGDGADEELFCIPSMSSGAWLPGPLIEARMTAPAPVLRLELPGDYLYRSKLEQARQGTARQLEPDRPENRRAGRHRQGLGLCTWGECRRDGAGAARQARCAARAPFDRSAAGLAHVRDIRGVAPCSARQFPVGAYQRRTGDGDRRQNAGGRPVRRDRGQAAA